MLAAPEDAAGIAEAIARLIADPIAVERLGANARALVAATFDAEVNFDRFFTLLATDGRAGRAGEPEPAREARVG